MKSYVGHGGHACNRFAENDSSAHEYLARLVAIPKIKKSSIEEY